LLAEFFDFLYLFIQHRCFLFQVSVAPFLIGYLGTDSNLHDSHQQTSQHYGNHTERDKLDLASLALFGTMWQ
jgi:hypothetical protein